MENNDNELRPDESSTKLSALISNLSEAEKKKLITVLVSSISKAKRSKLLEVLEKRQQNKLAEKRDHPRISSLIAVDCSTHDSSFINFIQDISNGGVFIETDAPFYISQEIIMNFSLPKEKNSITVKGKVVRVDSKGIGVKFIDEDTDELNIKA